MNVQKCGSLRFWGDWFGRPYDNWHVPTGAGYDRETDVLTIRFSGGERCTVLAPGRIVNAPKTFCVRSARKVVWEWYACGEQQMPQYLYRRVYAWENAVLTLLEYRGEQIVKRKTIDPQGAPAVEIC